MKRIAVVLCFLLLASLACTLTAQPGANAQVLSVPVVKDVPTGAPTVAPVAQARPTATPSPTPQARYVVTAQSVHVRSCPGVSCAAVEALSGGQVVTVLDTQEAPDGGTWSKINTQAGRAGWVNSRFLEKE